ncbi:hypothetical protein HMPREF3226_00345 [Prevotella corporis]|uniref:Uncharacterized protein n=1 Tax=Prevotella corporis TaxID=28128 RepID=A0A133QM04_9BACT|nr:hypothetical protein HMPREF3226_00345 [Prevotella corporis]
MTIGRNIFLCFVAHREHGKRKLGDEGRKRRRTPSNLLPDGNRITVADWFVAQKAQKPSSPIGHRPTEPRQTRDFRRLNKLP